MRSLRFIAYLYTYFNLSTDIVYAFVMVMTDFLEHALSIMYAFMKICYGCTFLLQESFHELENDVIVFAHSSRFIRETA